MTKRSASILLAALALAAAALAAVSPAALATSRDAAATRAYIRANYALTRAARANLGAGVAAIGTLVSQITGQCPAAAAGSPENHNSEQLSNEVVGALLISVYHFDTGAIGAFAHAVAGLRWSNSRLTRSVKGYVTKLQGISALALPDVCGDVRAWATDGFQALPEGTTSFDRSFYPVDVEAEEVPLGLLRPFAGHRGDTLLRRTKQLEAPLAETEANAVYSYTKILDSLGLNP